MNSESESSDVDTSAHQRSIFTKISLITHSTPSATPDKTTRMNSLSWGTSVSRPPQESKKRPLPPFTPAPIGKRHKRGPFELDSDSDSEIDGDSKGEGDNFNFDRHIMAPKLLVRHESPSTSRKDHNLPSSRATSERQTSTATPERQLFASSPTRVTPGNSLNMNRFRRAVLAKKQGDVGTTSTTQQEWKADLQGRPTNLANAGGLLQKKPSNAAVNGDVFAKSESHQTFALPGRLRSNQQNLRSPTIHDAGIISQAGQSGHGSQVKPPSEFSNTTNQSPSNIETPSRAQLKSLQKPTDRAPSQRFSTQADSKPVEASHALNSSLFRKANTASSMITSTSSPLRNGLDGMKAEHYGAAKQQSNVGSEWRKTQAERSSARSVTNTQRPEIGARYGHTLTAKRTSPLKAPTSTRTAPVPTAIPSAVEPSLHTSGLASPDYRATSLPMAVSNTIGKDLSKHAASVARTMLKEPFKVASALSQQSSTQLGLSDVTEPTGICHGTPATHTSDISSSSLASVGCSGRPDILLPSASISPSAEPYFEYTIHQALTSSWSGEIVTEITARPLTSLDTASVQMERSFQNSRQQFQLLGMEVTDTLGQVDDDGLLVQQSTFKCHEDPSKAVILKLWIERAEVSVHANHVPSINFSPSTIGKTVYAVRLWKLLKTVNAEGPDGDEGRDEGEEEGDEDEDEDKSEDGDTKDKPARVHHFLPSVCTEIYTTLDAANRAAKRVQVYLSHKDSANPMQKQWQTKNLQELNRKLENLREEMKNNDGTEEDAPPSQLEYEQGRRKGCWRSLFKVIGGGNHDDYEVLVCKVKVSGPRNI